jgi:cell division protease FtsH
VAAILVLNFGLASHFTGPEKRTRVPYSPFFLDQVQAGNVERITSRGTAVQGDLKRPATPAAAPAVAAPKPVKLFATEIPLFADTNALSRLLRAKGVSSPTRTRSRGSCARRASS